MTRDAYEHLDPDGKKGGAAAMRMDRRRGAQQFFHQLPYRMETGPSHGKDRDINAHFLPNLDKGLFVRTKDPDLLPGFL